jgi:hypothetical protein
MTTMRNWAIALAVSLMLAAEAFAVTFSLTPTVVRRFDEAFTPLAFDPAPGPITAGPGIYQVDYSFTIDGLSNGERGFGNTLFDLNLTGSLQNELGWNSMGVGASLDPFADSAPPNFFTNTDAGQNANDLKRIITSIPAHLAASDPRLTLGQQTAAYLGSVFVRWDGLTYSAIAAQQIQFSVVNSAGGFEVIPGTAAGSVLEFGTPADGAQRILPEAAYTPPPPPPPAPPVIEPPPVVTPPPTTPKPVKPPVNPPLPPAPVPPVEAPPAPPETLPPPVLPELPPEVPGDGPQLWIPPIYLTEERWIPSDPSAIDDTGIVAGGPRVLKWGDVIIYAVDGAIDIQPLLGEAGDYVITRAYTNYFGDALGGAALNEFAATSMRGAAIAGDATPTPEPASAALLALTCLAAYTTARRRA